MSREASFTVSRERESQPNTRLPRRLGRRSEGVYVAMLINKEERSGSESSSTGIRRISTH